MHIYKIFIALFAISFFTGCAEIEPPTPQQIITPWSSLATLRTGDTKDDVLDKWGEPDIINNLGVDEIGIEKQEWVYRGRYTSAPVDYEYLSKTKYLYFEGNILVKQETKSMQQSTDQEK